MCNCTSGLGSVGIDTTLRNWWNQIPYTSLFANGNMWSDPPLPKAVPPPPAPRSQAEMLNFTPTDLDNLRQVQLRNFWDSQTTTNNESIKNPPNESKKFGDYALWLGLGVIGAIILVGRK